MAKSNRGGKRGAGLFAKGELVLPDGSKIEFDGELRYDGDDPNVTGAVRQAVTAWEDKRVKGKIEYAYSVDQNGNPIGPEVKGGKKSVGTPRPYYDTPGATFTHIHPRGDGELGGTFSTADLRNFAKYSGTTIRAAAKEGTYSMSKKQGFDKYAFMNYIDQCYRNYNNYIASENAKLVKEYKNGNIKTYDEWVKKAAKSFNTGLVKLHDDYLKGQKKYNYTYTLEKR